MKDTNLMGKEGHDITYIVDEDDVDPETTPDDDTPDCCKCTGFCGYPLGQKAIGAVLLSLLALIMSLAGMGSCNFFVAVDDQDVVAGDGDGLMRWGFLWRESTELEHDATPSRISKCINWSASEKKQFDPTWKTASAFAFLTIITVVITTGVTLSLSCATVNRFYAQVLGSAFVFASVFEILVFIGLASEFCTSNAPELQCNLAFGAGIAIGGIVLCLLAALSLFVLVPPSPHPKPKTTIPEPDEEEARDAGVVAAAERENDADSTVPHEDEEDQEGIAKAHQAEEENAPGNPFGEDEEGIQESEAGGSAAVAPSDQAVAAENEFEDVALDQADSTDSKTGHEEGLGNRTEV